jgi:hypothetical protein
VVQLLGEALVKMRPMDAARWRLTSRDRLGPRDDHPLREALESVTQPFGFDRYELYLHDENDRAIVVHGERLPILVAPRSLASQPLGAQRFLLARTLAIFARGLAPASSFSAEELEMAIAAALHNQDPSYESARYDASELATLEKQIVKALSRRNRKALAAPAAELIAAGSIEVPTWRAAVARDSTRAAALLVGDLVACRDALVAMGTSTDDLLRFWASSRAFDLRRRAGL